VTIDEITTKPIKDLKNWVEENIKFEKSRLRLSRDNGDQIYRSSSLYTFLKVLEFIEVYEENK
jgi:hypothetical protein